MHTHKQIHTHSTHLVKECSTEIFQGNKIFETQSTSERRESSQRIESTVERRCKEIVRGCNAVQRGRCVYGDSESVRESVGD